MVLTADYSFLGDKNKIACSYPKLATSVGPGQEILVADGSLVLTVLECDEAMGEVRCRIMNDATAVFFIEPPIVNVCQPAYIFSITHTQILLLLYPSF